MRVFFIVALSLLCCQISSQSIIRLDQSESDLLVEKTSLASNDTMYRVQINIHGIRVENISENGIEYSKLLIDDDFFTYIDKGKPGLPIITQQIALPAGAEYNVSIDDSEYVDVSIGKIYPVQQTVLETDTTVSFCESGISYARPVYQPSFLKVIPCSKLNGLNSLNVSCCPFVYFPRINRLRVYKSFTINVSFHSENDNSLPPEIRRTNILHVFDNLSDLSEAISNNPLECEEDRYDYLIVAGDIPGVSNCNAMKKFTKWKAMKGYKTKVLSVNQIGCSCDSIKDFISSEYEKGIRYVLLVGSNTLIPAYEYDSYAREMDSSIILKNVTSDYWYACLDGDNDCFADVSIGRFSVRDTVELECMVDKTINYEYKRHGKPKQVDLVAHAENAPRGYQKNMEDVRLYNYASPMNFGKTYGAAVSDGGSDARNTDVINVINEGVNILNYRGHGVTDAWYRWNTIEEFFSNSLLNDLNPTDNPIIFSISCWTGNIGSIYAGSMLDWFSRSQNGSVAFLGASEASYTTPNNAYNKCLFKKLLNEGVCHFGDLNNAAHLQCIIASANNPYYIDNAFCYICGGDPTLEIWTGEINDFTHPSLSLDSIGNIVIDANVTGFSASVVSAPGELLELHYTDSNSMTIPRPASNVWVALNKHNNIPYILYINLEDHIIQDKLFSDNVYFLSSNSISVGSDITNEQPTGSVQVLPNGRLTINSSGDVMIKNDFEVTLGAELFIE